MTLNPASVAVILPAAGKSRRFGSDEKKIFARLGDRPVWEHAVGRLRQCTEIGEIIVAIAPEDRVIWDQHLSSARHDYRLTLVNGGAERVDSVLAGMQLAKDSPWIAIHDAARPLVRFEDLKQLFQAAEESGAAILAKRLSGTIKKEEILEPSTSTDHGPRIGHTVDRRGLWEALTPQVFKNEILTNAYHRWRGFPVTDDAQLVERAGYHVRLIEGSPTNLKITVGDDLLVASALLASERRSHR